MVSTLRIIYNKALLYTMLYQTRTEKLITIIAIFVLFGILIASAHGEEEFTEAENLIKQKIQCSQLTDEQLELIGEYYMEQMHPGELHEQMDEMMGGEGSAQLKQMHISMARSFYCGEHQAMSPAMTQMMMGGMMGSGMMLNSRTNNTTNLLMLILIILVVIAIIIWLLKTSKKRK